MAIACSSVTDKLLLLTTEATFPYSAFYAWDQKRLWNISCVVTKEEIDVSALDIDDSVMGAVTIDVTVFGVNVVDCITGVMTIGVSGLTDYSIMDAVTIGVSTPDDIVPDDSELVAESTIGIPTLDATVDS